MQLALTRAAGAAFKSRLCADGCCCVSVPAAVPHHAAADLPVGPSSCSAGQGLRYKPRKGDALLFYSQQPDLTLDPRSVHAGCPVGKGSEKWVVTKWIRDKPLVASGGFGWSN